MKSAKITLLNFICSLSCVYVNDIFTAQANANTLAQCPGDPVASATANCWFAPNKFIVNFYRVDICTAEPLSGNFPDLSSCTTMFNNPAGELADISGQATLTLSSTGRLDVNPGTYTHIHLVAENFIDASGTTTSGLTGQTTRAQHTDTGFGSDYCTNISGNNVELKCDYSLNGVTAKVALVNTALDSNTGYNRYSFSAPFTTAVVIPTKNNGGIVTIGMDTFMEYIHNSGGATIEIGYLAPVPIGTFTAN